ncbi:MAG: insulinase family protein [Bacteroidales bacterium]|nr:insulinase family protein [Bacteroidales bacterium]
MKKRLLMVVMLMLSSLGVMFAQQNPMAQPMPLDPSVRTGVLPNGLTYYIRHNELPKERCEFHIAQAVGSILEKDEQNGLAHFLEHMAFNGTEHYPGKGIITYFESIGVSFGGDINAYTSLDETVYRLSNVPTTRETIIDSALLVLRDWSCGLSLLGEEIDAERGVIREEWRTGATASRRMWKVSNELKYPGSQYAKRDVIGDTAVINNFAYEALRSYYKQWYGPDLQAIFVVGDIDVDVIEAKIKNLFSPIPERKNRGVRPIYPILDNKEPIVAIVTDEEAQNSRIDIEFKHPATPVEERKSLQGYVEDVLNSLIETVMSERFEALTADKDCPFSAAYVGYGELTKSAEALRAIVIPKNGKETEAYKALLTELYRAERYGFTSDELERAKADMLKRYEKSYNERNNQRSQSLTNEYIRLYLDGTPAPGIEIEYQLVKQFLPAVNSEMLNEMLKQEITEENIVIAFQGTPEAAANFPSKENVAAVMAEVRNSDIEAPKEEKIDRPLIEKMPKKGAIKKETKGGELGTTVWELKNGVKVVFKPTTFKQDEIMMSANSVGGLSLVKTADLPSAVLAVDIVENSGLGSFSAIELNKVLAGKSVSVSPSISNYNEGLSGNSSVADFETLMQLTYLYFTSTRLDEDAWNAMADQYRSALANRDKNPKVAFSDSIQTTLSEHSPRTIIVNNEMLNRVDANRAVKIFQERFANAADFTFYFVGNINPDDENVKNIILTYLGGLKTSKSRENVGEVTPATPKGMVKNYFSREMSINTASNLIVYSAKNLEFTQRNSMMTSIIGDILGTRYLESIREREGGSYGVGTYGSLSVEPYTYALILMQFDTDPEKEEKLMGIIHQEVMEIVNNGPLAVDLSKTKENMLKEHQDNLEKNSYWMNAIKTYYRYGINIVKDYEANVKSIDAKSIQNWLKTIVDQKNVVEVVMTPKK